MDDFFDPALMLAYGTATAECRHESIFTVWDSPVVVLLCEACGLVFTGDSDLMEAELVRPFVEALER